MNAIREICIRCPLCMTSELLHDLSAYKSHHSKSVMMAARSLIQLFRDLNPQMLKRKDRVRCRAAIYNIIRCVDFLLAP